MTVNARIRSFADRIERLDEEIKALNEGKKEIYAEMKGEGFDTRAFKAAHRRHLAHEKNCITAQEGEALTDLYFVALQGAGGSESPPAAKFGAAKGLPEKPSRAPARKAIEPQSPVASGMAESSGGLEQPQAAPAAPCSQANASKVEPGNAGSTDAAVRHNNDRAGLLVGAAGGADSPAPIPPQYPTPDAAGQVEGGRPRVTPSTDNSDDMDIPAFLRRTRQTEAA